MFSTSFLTCLSPLLYFQALFLLLLHDEVSGRIHEAVFDMGNGKVVVVDKFVSDCPEHEKAHYFIYFDNLTVSGTEGKISIDYDAVAEKDITDPLHFHVDIQRCRSKENPDSCMKFASFKTSRLCSLVNDRKQFWSSMLTCAEPAIKCPVGKGVFRGRGCKLDMSRFNWFPIGDSYWRLRVTVSDKGGVIGCTLNEGKMATMKSK